MLQPSHPYMTNGKSTALTIWTFVVKVMSLLFNTLSRFAIAFLPRSKHLLISWWTPHLSEFAQVYVHWTGDAIQPSHPLSSLSPPAFNLSQHLGSFQMSQLFASGGQSIGASASASVLPKNIQGWFPLGLTGWISLQSKGFSRVFSSATVQKHQFFSAQLYL